MNDKKCPTCGANVTVSSSTEGTGFYSPVSRDALRLDWLADPKNSIGNVQLPAKCVENNVHSLRDAIDEAMEMSDAK